MKRILAILAAAAVVFSACSELETNPDDVSVNSDIASVKTVVEALQTNGYAKSVKDSDDGTYTVTLRSGSKVAVRVASSDSEGPVLGACKGEDGAYYWTLEGRRLEYRVDDRQTPQLKAEDGGWNVTFDNGKTWSPAGGYDGGGTPSLFRAFDYDEEKVTFTFMDGNVLVLHRSCPIDITFDRPVPLEMEPNSALELGYTIVSAIPEVTVKVKASADLKVEELRNGSNGRISIRTGGIIDNSSQVSFTISDGKNTVVRYLKFVPAEGELLALRSEEINLSAASAEFDVVLRANLKYEIESMPEWIESVSSAPGKDKYDIVHVFRVQMNESDDQPRTGEIVFCSEGGLRAVFTVNQNFMEYLHRSVAVRYTADWCGYCPNMASGFKEAEMLMPGKLEVISLHCDGALVYDNSDEFANQFRISGYPTGIVDGRMMVGNYDVATIAQYTKKYAEETATLYSTVSAVGIASSLSGRELTVEVDAYLDLADSYKITVMLVEDGIVAWQNGASANYVHNGVLRDVLTRNLGDSFETSADRELKEFSYKTTIGKNFSIEKMRIVVYIERSFGERNRVQSKDYGDYYIDNCATCKVGGSLDVQYAE